MGRARIPIEERRRRRNDRDRLISYLSKGGSLREERAGPPVGVVWVYANRSDSVYTDKQIRGLRTRGCVIRGEAFVLRPERLNGTLVWRLKTK